MKVLGLVAFVCALMVTAACSDQARPSGSAVTSLVATASANLLSHPLRSSALPSGAPCPATSVSDVKVGVTSPRGGPDFYLGGPNPKAGSPWNKTVYALVGATGPVLVRGARLDGPGTLKFDGVAADPAAKGETLTSPGGVAATFYDAVLSPGAGGDVFYLYPTVPGCYALQADGDGFEDIVVFIAAP
jgi:hypothetical protein